MDGDPNRLLEGIDSDLRRAGKILDQVAHKLRDADFDRGQNIRRIGEALVKIFEIQNQIYGVRPDLKPDFLKKGE